MENERSDSDWEFLEASLNWNKQRNKELEAVNTNLQRRIESLKKQYEILSDDFAQLQRAHSAVLRLDSKNHSEENTELRKHIANLTYELESLRRT